MCTKWFNKLSKKDIVIAGGKGASLGEMTQLGIAVPDGFVILTNAFENFLQENNLAKKIDSELEKIDVKKMETVEKASREVQKLILSAKIPSDIQEEIKKKFAKLDTKFVA
ncbi:MAG TPA: phosphoenolpyruvate synthase, partial [Candidatus Moranbacteria bacterium]|nr:phosphoenolpyruvate synthase [Candidatus Moranbacteria bacterium]